MKLKLSILILLLPALTSVNAQTLKEVKTHIYYQRYETAKQTLQALINKGNEASEVWYWLSEIYLKEKKVNEAYKTLLNIPSNILEQAAAKKKNPLLFIGWAHVLLDSGLVNDGHSQMEDILKLSKYRDTEVLLAAAKANIQSKNGDIKWAVELLGEAIKRDKKNPEIYTALGDAYKKIIDGTNAIRYYDKALDVDPSYAEAMYKKGLIYITQNNTEVYIDRFSKAYNMDTAYAPAIYQLYWHYFRKNNTMAKKMLTAYVRHSDRSPEHDYMSADLQYVAGEYSNAINIARGIIHDYKEIKPRLYKLIAYSYAELKDSSLSLHYMKEYFARQDLKETVSKDYELMAKLHESQSSDKSAVIDWLKKALVMETDKKQQLQYMITLADMQKELGNREREAIWREKVYNNKKSPTNLDIYKWGVALYSAEDYVKADSVFAMYEQKYPDQIYGYLWRARSNALIDTTMEKGLAIPHYMNLVKVALKDSISNKANLLSAYAYLGTYEANIKKDYPASLNYFNSILQIDPENADGLKYKEILEAWIDKGLGINNTKAENK